MLIILPLAPGGPNPSAPVNSASFPQLGSLTFTVLSVYSYSTIRISVVHKLCKALQKRCQGYTEAIQKLYKSGDSGNYPILFHKFRKFSNFQIVIFTRFLGFRNGS